MGGCEPCEKCVHDMAQYKLICDNGATTWTAGARSLLGLAAKLEALKNLA